MNDYARQQERHAKRRAEICLMRAKGATLEAVGKRFGISRQRVLQITKNGKTK